MLYISDLHSKFALRPHHTICGSMVDIQSATAEIRRGGEEERKKKHDKNIMSASATQGNHNNVKNFALNKECVVPIYLSTP